MATDETFVGDGSIGSVSAAELAEVRCFSSSNAEELNGHLLRFDGHFGSSLYSVAGSINTAIEILILRIAETKYVISASLFRS